MIKIDLSRYASVAPEYWRLLKNFLNGKRNKSKLLAYAKRIKTKGYSEQLEYINDGLVKSDRIALGKPYDIIGEYSAQFKDAKIKRGLIKRMEGYYALFFNTKIGKLDPNHPNKELKIGTWLAKELNVNTCPYCNRAYTFSGQFSDEKEIRPEFDHFYPKSKYPYLALSLYNLVPSCRVCNQLKGDEEIEINPLFEDFEEKNIHFRLRDVVSGQGYDPEVDHWAFDPSRAIVEMTKSNSNITRLKLDEFYNMHTDVVADLVTKVQAYNNCYYQSLVDSYKGLGKTQEDIYRLIWGTYMNSEDYKLRPLSKFTKDILEQIDVN